LPQSTKSMQPSEYRSLRASVISPQNVQPSGLACPRRKTRRPSPGTLHAQRPTRVGTPPAQFLLACPLEAHAIVVVSEDSDRPYGRSGEMANTQIAIVNASTVVPDKEVGSVVAALQKQVRSDFAPIWGIDADLTAVAPGKIPSGAWVLAILDDSDQAGA